MPESMCYMVQLRAVVQGCICKAVAEPVWRDVSAELCTKGDSLDNLAKATRCQGATLSGKERSSLWKASNEGLEPFAKSQIQDHRPLLIAFAVQYDEHASVGAMR